MPAQPWMADFRKIGDADEIQRIRELSKVLERSIQAEFLKGVEALRGKIDLAAIVKMLEAGQVGEAIAAVSAEMVANSLGPVGVAISNAAITAGQEAAKVIGQLKHLHNLEVVFRATNPATTQHLHAYEMSLIREMTTQALDNVRRVITDGMLEGRHPDDVARDVRQHIGLTRYQSRVVQNYRRNLENLHHENASERAAARAGARGRALRDKRYDGLVERVIRQEKALTKEQIDSLVSRYEGRWLKYRSETIARTEAIRALNTGNQEAWRQSSAEGMFSGGRVRRDWVYTHDARTRSWHRNIPALNKKGVGLEEPFKSDLGPIMYPGDPNAQPANTINCRCTVVFKYIPTVLE